MRKFDHEGLLLASFQAELFEDSVTKALCSSPLFFKWFSTSDIAKELDTKHSALIDLNKKSVFEILNKECNDSNSVGEIFDASTMFWLGYIYRYICYTRQCSTEFVFNLIPPSELRYRYYVYHTQSEEWAINRILETKGLTEEIFNK